MNTIQMRLAGARYFSSVAASVKPYSMLFFGSEEYARATLFSLMSKPNYSRVLKRVAVVAPAVLGINTPSEAIHELLKSKNIEKYTFRKQFKALERYIREQEKKDEFPFDLGVVASFDEEIPESIINLFPKGVLVAHPFRLDVSGLLKSGENTIDIEVTNLSANRIRDLDRRKVVWRKFHEINIVDHNYRRFDASEWPDEPSGLLGPVGLIPFSAD